MTAVPEYTSLSASEREWIDAHLDHGRKAGVDPTDPRSIGEFYDSSFAAVQRGDRPAADANAVVNVVAALVGELVCATPNLTWAIVTDEFGTDLCVHDATTSWVLFPQSAVAKRWEAGETGWVVPFVTWVQEQVSYPPR